MYADVTEGFAAFASVNAALPGSYRPIAVTRYALALLSAASRGQALPDAPPPPPSPAVIKNASEYAGTFSSPDGGKLVLVSEGEQLILQHAGSRIVLELAGKDSFLVKHPDFALFTLKFGREKDVVVEAFHGAGWWTNERYSGLRKFEYPREWDAYTGHFHSDSPWYGSTRVVIRKGQLLIDGDQPLAPVEPRVFRPADDPGDADRITFDTMIDGQATRMHYSGIEFFRTSTP
jgi:D-alanyl-D-alanine carboxypeptidase